jgi:hypothetical protein
MFALQGKFPLSLLFFFLVWYNILTFRNLSPSSSTSLATSSVKLGRWIRTLPPIKASFSDLSRLYARVRGFGNWRALPPAPSSTSAAALPAHLSIIQVVFSLRPQPCIFSFHVPQPSGLSHVQRTWVMAAVALSCMWETAPAVLAAATMVKAAPGMIGRGNSPVSVVETLTSRCSSSALPNSSAHRRRQAKMPWHRCHEEECKHRYSKKKNTSNDSTTQHPHAPVLPPTPHRAIGSTPAAASDGAQYMLDEVPTRYCSLQQTLHMQGFLFYCKTLTLDVTI